MTKNVMNNSCEHCEHVINKLWTIYQQNMCKIWATFEQHLIYWLRNHVDIISKSWTKYEHDMKESGEKATNKTWMSHEKNGKCRVAKR